MPLAVSPDPFGEALRARDRRNAASARSPVSSGGGTDTTCGSDCGARQSQGGEEKKMGEGVEA
jgi:hypothetical protein